MPQSQVKMVPDTSALIEGILTQKITNRELFPQEIIIHEAIFAVLEQQANANKEIGFLGLDELKSLHDAAKRLGIPLRFAGKRPTPQDIKYATLKDIDSLIRQLAYDEGATLLTADKVQAKVAETRTISTLYIEPFPKVQGLLLEQFFDSQTMSCHLKEGVLPYAKKGTPGHWEFVEVRQTKLTREEIMAISREIIEAASVRKDSFIEIEREGSTIVQLGNFRIVITKPPFSDGWEITAVRPVRKMGLSDYKLTEKLQERIASHAEGMLVAGAPGQGKSTFASALAEFYAAKKKIVKTVEAPRDLILPENITQYAVSHSSSEEIHDVLLLSRPDYAVFDEMRNTDDFKLFADLRLSGIGFIGVIHATNPIDAIQRFVGRIELGVIPQIIDTVIFIRHGTVEKVLNLEIVVKVPAGMTEADLARPVVVVHDFETAKAVYELYTYGEQTVMVPVRESIHATPASALAARAIEQELSAYHAKVQMKGEHRCAVSVAKDDVPRLIGRQGKNIEELEQKLGIGIDVVANEEHNNLQPTPSELQRHKPQALRFETKMANKFITFYVEEWAAGRNAEIRINNQPLFTAGVGANAQIRIKKQTDFGKTLVKSINRGDKIEVVI